MIRARGGDYLFALKANRPAMLREVEAFFADPPAPLAAFETKDADHGRVDKVGGVRPPPFALSVRSAHFLAVTP